VKRKINDGYLHKGTRYVMIAGDGSQVPVRFRFVGLSQSPFTGASFNMSDLYYANLFRNHDAYGNSTLTFDNWDANGNGLFNEEYLGTTVNPDSVDGYPDVALGRVLAATPTDMTTYVNKVITYEGWPQMSMSQGSTAFFADCNYAGATGMLGQVLSTDRSPTAGNDYEVLNTNAACTPLPANAFR